VAGRTLAAIHDIGYRRQNGPDLGARMQDALEWALQRAPWAVLIGSDCPGYDSDYLQTAFAALERHDAVLGPALDGGYVLIGMRRAAPELFADMPWSTTGVLDTTRQRLQRKGWSWQELPTLRDIDTPQDLAHALSILREKDAPDAPEPLS
jgi:rSAM/selenodomain-associated transferase 1